MKYRTSPLPRITPNETDVRTALRRLGDRVLAERRTLTPGEWDVLHLLREQMAGFRQERRQMRQARESKRAA